MANQSISKAYLDEIRSLLNKALNDYEYCLAQYITQPKYPELVDDTSANREATSVITSTVD
jgi:hypothetical protein